jgi:uracil phosphoribosyltransferase
MISAFAQGIKNHAEIKNEISLLRNILTKHDSNFMELLKQILSKLLIELNRLQKLRKVTSAYMNSQFSLGG